MSTAKTLCLLRLASSWKRLAYLAIALPSVCRAAVRLYCLRHESLDVLVVKARAVPRFSSAVLHRPRELAVATSDLMSLAYLGRREGRCWWRALLLLDLLARCNAEPRLHVGMAHSGQARHLHAWVTAAGLAEPTPNEFTEIWAA